MAPSIARSACPALLALSLCACGGGDNRKSDERPPTSPAPSDSATPTTPTTPTPADPGLEATTLHGKVPRKAKQIELVGQEVWMHIGEELYRWPLKGESGLVGQLGVDTRLAYFRPPAVYTVDAADWKVRRHDTETGKKVTLGKSTEMPSPALYGVGDELLWTTKKGILAMPIAGGDVRVAVALETVRNPIRFSGAQVVFSNGEHIIVATRGKSAMTKLAPVVGRLSGLLLARDRVYWRDDNRIASAPVAGGAVTVHAKSLGKPGWLAVGAKAVYWLDLGTADQGRIRATDLASGTTRTVLSGPLSAGVAVVGNDRLYFTSRAGDLTELRSMAVR